MRFNSPFIQSLNSRKYWAPTKDVFDFELDQRIEQMGEKKAAESILDYLERIIQDSKEGVKEIQRERVARGEISDTRQSDVSIAGNNYQALVAYSLEINRIVGNIPSSLKIAFGGKGKRKHPMIEKYATIEVAKGESQKPDVDVLVFKEGPQTPIIIYSCKTSLRERAGQTYRWKLLMDLARCKCTHEESCPLVKYQLRYPEQREILVGLITANFYEEREKPQQRGMFTFFDYVYVSRPIQPFYKVQRLSKIISDLNTIFLSSLIAS